MDPVTTARELAATHPRAMLPCPLCAASVRAENLARHLARSHDGAPPAAATRWRGRGLLGVFPCALELDGDAMVLHHTFGLMRRRVALPCALEVGALRATRPDATVATYAATMNMPGETVRTGSYLRLVGDAAITIGCRSGTPLTAHWDAAGFRRGAPRRACDVVVDRAALVAIEYALARRGMLTPRSDDRTA